MIISRTPLRISFVGGGSDLPIFYKLSQGSVISTAIDKYVYITVQQQFDKRIIVSYSKTEIVKDVNRIENNLVRESMKMTGVTEGIHITSISDVPSEGTGLGSSSSYTVGLLNALYTFKGKFVNAERLAREACEIEINILKKPIGKQDQYIAAYGGLQNMRFNKDETVFIDPVILSDKTKKSLENRLLLFYTGITRSADPILKIQNLNLKKNLDSQQSMREMVSVTDDLLAKLRMNDLSSFGESLDKNWQLKKQMAEGITNDKINKIYLLAKKNGASGGKLLGAGGGGFMLFVADKKEHKKIINSLPQLIHVPFKFEPQGSKIIFIG